MKFIIVNILFLALSLLACKNPVEPPIPLHEEQITDASISSGSLVHMVYFNLQDSLKTDSLLQSIKALKDIDALLSLNYGRFTDLGDPRAIDKYNVVMMMSLKDETAYQVYQDHPLHLQLKEAAGRWLASPPMTYDFIAE